MSIPDFIERCDAYCGNAGVSRRWLSKRLFADTYRIENLAEGGSDVGVKRLDQALDDLLSLEAAHKAGDQGASQEAAA